MRLARDWLPPALQEFLRPYAGRGVHYSGRFNDWAAASARTPGYDDAAILDKVKTVALRTRAGEAVAERDGVELARVEHSWPVVACCLRAATERDNRLCVLDFGGSLGTSYFQCRDLLRTVDIERWSVVEQPHFARCGQELFQDRTLRFFDNIEDCVRESAPDLALLSSVLQYLPDPKTVLATIMRAAPRYIVLDRTPVWDGQDDWITVQHVPARIYRASYPCRIFSAAALRREFAPCYELLAEFPGSDGEARASGIAFRFVGMVFRLR